jgi:hypothetical protein
MSKTKMFIKKSAVVLSCLFASACLLLGVVYGVSKASLDYADYLFPAYITPSVNVPDRKPLTMKEWVLAEVKKAGMDVALADKIIACESNWRPDAHAVNWNNKAGVDRGLWMINSLAHKDVSNACSYDFKCSTAEAIKIYKSRGNYSAWSCLPIVLAKK